MAATALKFRKSDDAPASRGGPRLTLVPPSSNDVGALMEWARGVTAAANRQVETLEERIAHLETLIGSDELTGLLNRRGFMGVFARANAAAKRGGAGGVVVVCDLDGFKNVNDRLGHAQGDDVLRQLGAILRRKTRQMDAAARLGGDEFALMLVGVAPATAKRKCQCLGRMIATLGVGASFGLAVFDGEDSEDAILHRADMAMYEEKRRHATALPERD